MKQFDEHEFITTTLGELADKGITGWQARQWLEWDRVCHYSKPLDDHAHDEWWDIELCQRRN